MSHDQADQQPLVSERADAEPAMPVPTSRRHVLRAAAAGAVVTAGGVALPSAAVARATGGVAGTQPGALAFSGVMGIDQEGAEFTGYGFLDEVAGIPGEVLFGDVLDRTEALARLTITGAVTLEQRTIRANVFVLDAVGTLELFSLDAPGASFDDPATFASGTAVAGYSVTLHDVLTVIAPNQGLPVLTGELIQTAASDFMLDDAWYRIGSPGARLTLAGTGLGTRSDADLPRAHLDLAVQVHYA
jgi:hypothetical protein